VQQHHNVSVLSAIFSFSFDAMQCEVMRTMTDSRACVNENSMDAIVKRREKITVSVAIAPHTVSKGRIHRPSHQSVSRIHPSIHPHRVPPHTATDLQVCQAAVAPLHPSIHHHFLEKRDLMSVLVKAGGSDCLSFSALSLSPMQRV